MVDPFPMLSKFYNNINQLFRHLDFGFTFCCFPGSAAMTLSRPPIPRLLVIFLLGFFFNQTERPTDPISGNAFDTRRKKKGG